MKVLTVSPIPPNLLGFLPDPSASGGADAGGGGGAGVGGPYEWWA